MNIYIKILLSFVSASATVALVFGGYIYAQDDRGDLDFENVNMEFDYLQRAYHGSMDKFFNAKILKMVKILDDDKSDPLKNPDFNAPDKVEDCGEENVSTYCVAYQALDMYSRYFQTLDKIRQNVVRLEDVTQGVTWELLASLTSERNKEIDVEIEEAKMVMEATLDAYNEFRLAYPMHREYRKILINLMKYKGELETIKDEARQFPLRFVDATTTDCL